MRKPNRVFITYAWEGSDYRRLVKRFAARLRQDGINARLDAWHLEGLTVPQFMAREVRNADKIIVLCSPQYRKNVHTMEDGQRPSGSGWEAMLITSTIWARLREPDQIVAVLFRGQWTEAAPDFLIGSPYIDLIDGVQFEANYLVLLQNVSEQREKAPVLGAPPELPPQVIEPLRGSLGPVTISAHPHISIVSSAAVPRQLPSPPSDFVGRKADISRLISAVRQGGATISGVRGIAGVGKTALALVIAEVLAADFPVGQIYLDLKGAQERQNASGVPPLTAREAMEHVIHSFDPRAKIPSSDSEREGLYRTTLSGKRVLLLMDNALNQQQVERLVPPSGCVMIVTSREHFTLPGMLAHDVAELPPSEARELLMSIAPRIRVTADKIAKLCGYLPAALRAAGSILVNAPNLTPTDLLRRMSDAQRRLSLTGVELSLTTSSELLSSNDLRNEWFQLGAFPGTFDEMAAAAIWGTSNEDARSKLSSLLCYSLVEFDHKHHRYYLHDLVRDFTLSRLQKSTEALARFRHSVYFLDIFASADCLYRAGGAAVAIGLEMFDTERLNIEVGQRWAATHAHTSKDAARLSLAYADAGMNILHSRFSRREQVAWLNVGLRSVARLSKPSSGRREVFVSEVRLMTNLADVLLAQGDIHKARQF